MLTVTATCDRKGCGKVLARSRTRVKLMLHDPLPRIGRVYDLCPEHLREQMEMMVEPTETTTSEEG